MRIPTANNQAQLNPLPTVRKERLVNTTGESWGQALGNVGSVVQQIQVEEKQKAYSAAVFGADMALSKWGADTLRSAKQVKGNDAIGLADKALTDYDRLAGEQEKSLTSNRAKTVFRQQAQQRRLQYAGQLGEIEDRERESYYQAQGTAYREQEQNAAGQSYQDPKAIAAAIDRQDASAEVQFSKEPPEVIALAKQENRAKTYAKVFDQMLADQDLVRAKTYFSAVEKDMDSELAARVKNGIHTLEARKESEARAAQAEQRDILGEDLRNAFAARQMGIPAVMPGKSAFVAAYGEEGSKRYQAAASQWHAYDAAGIAATMPPNEAMQYLSTLKPATQEGAADAKAGYDLAVKLYADQRTRLEADPVATIAQTHPEIAALASDTNTRNEYFRRMAATQKALGIDKPKLLSELQRDALAREMDFDPEEPRGRAEYIAKLRDEYGSNFLSIMREVAPKLEGQARVMVDMNPEQAIRLDAATAQQKELNSLVKGTDATDINEQLDVEFEDLATTLADNADAEARLAEFRNAAELLAKADVLRGTKPQEAARKAAAAVVNDQYKYVGTMRIPAAYDPAIVSRAAERAQTQLARDGEFAIAAGSRSDAAAAQSDLRSLIQRQGYWVTNESGTGLVLRVPHRSGMGDVYKKDGSRVELSLDELSKSDAPDNRSIWLLDEDAP